MDTLRRYAAYPSGYFESEMLSVNLSDETKKHTQRERWQERQETCRAEASVVSEVGRSGDVSALELSKGIRFMTPWCMSLC